MYVVVNDCKVLWCDLQCVIIPAVCVCAVVVVVVGGGWCNYCQECLLVSFRFLAVSLNQTDQLECKTCKYKVYCSIYCSCPYFSGMCQSSFVQCLQSQRVCKGTIRKTMIPALPHNNISVCRKYS